MRPSPKDEADGSLEITTEPVAESYTAATAMKVRTGSPLAPLSAQSSVAQSPKPRRIDSVPKPTEELSFWKRLIQVFKPKPKGSEKLKQSLDSTLRRKQSVKKPKDVTLVDTLKRSMSSKRKDVLQHVHWH
jgi:hypothetical protein